MLFRSNETTLSSVASTTNFRGGLSQVRMWSKYLSGSEWNEHVRNPFNFGVKYPSVNFNFTTHESGSFERLRIDASIDQPISSSDSSGKISFIDFTQNGLSLSGTNFPISTVVVSPYEMVYQAINSHFDEASTDEKVRVRS